MRFIDPFGLDEWDEEMADADTNPDFTDEECQNNPQETVNNHLNLFSDDDGDGIPNYADSTDDSGGSPIAVKASPDSNSSSGSNSGNKRYAFIISASANCIVGWGVKFVAWFAIDADGFHILFGAGEGKGFNVG